MADDPAPTPTPTPTPTPAPVPAPAPRDDSGRFASDTVVHDLREENKARRLEAKEAREAAVAAAKAAKDAKDELDAFKASQTEAETARKAADAEAQKKADDRVIRAELRALATKAGMHDLDGLKLADTSTLKINDETGEVEGADALMTALKEAKPYLFGPARPGTGSSVPPPTPALTGKKLAKDMTDDEYRAALASIDAGRGVPT